mgnify:FL=1
MQSGRKLQKIPDEKKKYILELLKKGVNIRTLAQRYNIPLSTIRTWKSKTNPEKKERFYNDVLPVEAKLFSIFCPYLKDDLKDTVYENLQKQLQKELNVFAKEIVQKVLIDK